jgi:hypothetical protein
MLRYYFIQYHLFFTMFFFIISKHHIESVHNSDYKFNRLTQIHPHLFYIKKEIMGH